MSDLQVILFECHFSGEGDRATRSIGPHCITIMLRLVEKLQENQRLNQRLSRRMAAGAAACIASAGQSAPRSLGFSASVTQLAEAAGPQPPRLSSAWANNSASFGSFPAESSVNRLSMQPTAARRAGSVSP